MGKGDSDIFEDAVRSHLGLDLLDRMWARAELAEQDAIDLAVEAQHKTRRRQR